MALKNNISLLFLSTIFCCIATNTFAEETSSVLPKDDKQHHRSYLKPNEIANSVDLLPPPPAENSPAFMADQAAFKQAQSLINTPRWALAQSDADLADHHIGKPFAQVLGVTISKENTPITYLFLKKIMVDSGYSGTHLAKKYYHRIRPFMYYHTQTCTPQDNHYLKNDGSYPSGHTAIGWSTALILSEMFPEKQNQILQRGYDFGESRVVCGVHWQSDVDVGRIIGSEIVARLHANKEFLQDFQKSKEELTQKMK